MQNAINFQSKVKITPKLLSLNIGVFNTNIVHEEVTLKLLCSHVLHFTTITNFPKVMEMCDLRAITPEEP